MSYSAIDIQVRAARTDNDVKGKVGIGLLKKATVRGAPASNPTKEEQAICRAVIEGTHPISYTTAVLFYLDIAGVLATPTDAQVDTAVDSAWTGFVNTKLLPGL